MLPKSSRAADIAENAHASSFELSAKQLETLDALETGQPSYWDPACVDRLDTFNIFMDKEALQRELGAG